ncbi:hypothetical protein [Chakrabartyella piscis]|uniref:hypothetical protein n=1 Tax=Chakrabartyella piscis TaxID=2918914 RepID=UPI002958C0E4|nr:hypothetical protein [Chakrabartyella piscis]
MKKKKMWSILLTLVMILQMIVPVAYAEDSTGYVQFGDLIMYKGEYDGIIEMECAVDFVNCDGEDYDIIVAYSEDNGVTYTDYEPWEMYQYEGDNKIGICFWADGHSKETTYTNVRFHFAESSALESIGGDPDVYAETATFDEAFTKDFPIDAEVTLADGGTVAITYDESTGIYAVGGVEAGTTFVITQLSDDSTSCNIVGASGIYYFKNEEWTDFQFEGTTSKDYFVRTVDSTVTGEYECDVEIVNYTLDVSAVNGGAVTEPEPDDTYTGTVSTEGDTISLSEVSIKDNTLYFTLELEDESVDMKDVQIFFVPYNENKLVFATAVSKITAGINTLAIDTTDYTTGKVFAMDKYYKPILSALELKIA